MSVNDHTFLGIGVDSGENSYPTQVGEESDATGSVGFPVSLDLMGQISIEENGFLRKFLDLAGDANISDIHFSELEALPVCRVARTCVRVPQDFKFPDLRDGFDKVVHKELMELCPAYKDESDPYRLRLKVSFRVGSKMVRVACYLSEGVRVAALRLQPLRPRDVGSLGFSNSLLGILSNPEPGLVLISGGTSCGKSSTLASLVQFYVSETDHHIRTLEDPFEYEYMAGAGYLTRQRVSKFGDVPTYAEAVEGSLSHDVNVLVFGELRDEESVKQAVFASGLNMLVIATIHAQDVSGTVARVLSAYAPSDRREALRALEGSLKAVVSQKIKLRGGKPALLHESAVFRSTTASKENSPSFSRYFEENGYANISKDTVKEDLRRMGWSPFE